MHLTARLVQYTSWVEPRLAYASRTDVSQHLKDSKVDLSDVTDKVWKPNIAFTELNRQSDLVQDMYVYPNGTIEYYKETMITLTCDMNYADIPSDHHHCFTTAYIQNDFKDTAILKWV